jgi:hypothetical protein
MDAEPGLSEENRSRMFDNRVARRIFGPEREKIARGGRKLRNEELLNLYVSSHIIRVVKSRRISWDNHVARMRELRHECKTLV